MQVIIYKNDSDGVSIVYPTQEALSYYNIMDIALKDVPAGKKFKIVDIEELPLDGTFNMYGVPNIDTTSRDQWYVDESELIDGVGAEKNTFNEVA